MTKMNNNDKNLNSRIALLSVYDKSGIVEFAKELINLGFKLFASGGTAKTIKDAGIEVSDVADLVGGRAILGHRVVTLSREIYAGLLSRDTKEDNEELYKLNIPRIDLVCVDLYPLEEEIEKWTLSENADESARYIQAAKDAIVEKTDIGGPTLLRAAAKGRRIVVCDASDRQKTIDWLKDGEPDKEQFLSDLAAKAEYSVANYALVSARYHSGGKMDGFLAKDFIESKYGENAWQTPAGLFADKSARYTDRLSLSNFDLISGTAPSYNNLADLDRLLQTITHIAAGFEVNFNQIPKIVVGVKHGNACGAAVSDNASDAVKNMLEGDLRAIFGGVVMLNFKLDEVLAEVLLSHKMEEGRRRILDTIAAPAISEKAIEMLKRKGDKCRFLVNPALANLSKQSLDTHPRFRYVRGGFLKQPNYTFVLNLSPAGDADKSARYNLEIIGSLSEEQKKDIILAWAIGSTSNSNTVTITKNRMLLGNGVGQQDRVGGCELAIKRAKDSNHGLLDSTAYSDSFFPFTDGPEKLAEAGVKIILATSGSVKDEEIKKFCEENNISLVMVPDKLARGFFGH